jgi:hypothetical protein
MRNKSLAGIQRREPVIVNKIGQEIPLADVDLVYVEPRNIFSA